MNVRLRVLCFAPVLLLAAGMPAVVQGQAENVIDNRTISGARQLYAQHSRMLIEKRDADIADLDARYTQSLRMAAEQAQKAGQLEQLLAIRRELERVEKKRAVPDRPRATDDPNVTNWQEAYNRQYAAIMSDHATALAGLTTRYIEHLDYVKRELTKAGNVEEALAFMREYERMKKDAPQPEPVAASPAPVTLPPPAQKTMTPLELLKTIGLDRRIVAFDGGGTFAGPLGATVQVTHEDRNRIADGAIQLRGGRTMIEGVDDLLLAACKAAQAITITAEISPRQPRQEGPARIISFSLDAHRRNVSLCQEGRDLVLRLRTSDTGPNGTDPQITLYSFEREDREKRERRDRETHKIAVTYRPGDLRFFLDGERVEVDGLTGNFDNWEPCRLVLGNEWEGDRPWIGSLNQFAIYARFMPDLEAKLKTRR